MKNELKNIRKNRYLKGRLPNMTYILGTKCKNCVVLVADKKGLMGTKPIPVTKIEKIGNLGFFAFAGVGSTYSRFKRLLPSELQRQECITLDERLMVIGDLVRTLNEEESEKHNCDEKFELFYAYHNKDTNKAELQHIDIVGHVGEINAENPYHAIGEGEPYGELFLKTTMTEMQKELNKDKTFNDWSLTQSVGVLIIRAIEKFRLCESVGYWADTLFLNDDGTYSFVSFDDLENMGLVEELKNKTDNMINYIGAVLTGNLKNNFTNV